MGFVLSVIKKIYNDTQKDYGKICQINDKINVSFYVNDENKELPLKFTK